MKSRIQPRHIALAIAIVLTAAALTVLLTSFYFAQPTADDFIKAANGRRGILAVASNTYFEQGGRWSTNIVQGILFTRIPILNAYPLLLLLNSAILVLAIFRLLTATAGELFPASTRATAALFFLLTVWTVANHPGDTFFWATGGLEYLVNTAAALCLLANLLTPAPSRILTPLLALYLGGSHELIVLLTAILLTAGAWALHHRGDTRAKTWRIYAILMWIFLATLAASPGAASRAQRVDGNFQPARAILLTIARFGRFLPTWIVSAPVLLSAAWLVTDPRLAPGARPRPSTLAQALALLLTMVALTLFLPAISLGGYAADRVTTLAAIELVLGLLFITAAAARTWNIPTATARLHPARPYLIPLLAASIFYGPACQLALASLPSEIPAWYRSVRSRYQDLQQQAASGQKEAIATPVPPTPGIYFDFTLNADPTSYPNRAAARFFGFQSITVPPTSQSAAPPAATP